jgi:hypothetical protein
MRKINIKRATDRDMELIELCLPRVFRGPSRGRTLCHGVRVGQFISDMRVKVRENK